jgi:hypothetical protein
LAATKTKTDTNPRSEDAQDEREDEQRADEQERSRQSPHDDRPNIAGTVLRGAIVGSAAGAAIGAWAAFAKVMWPEQIERGTGAVTQTAREVGRSAARAAAQTVDAKAVAELLPGNDDRTDAVKRTARDAATAAAKAAREAISTMSEGANGSGSARNRKEGD